MGRDHGEKNLMLLKAPQRSSWTIYAAAAWSFVFAAISFYWAAGCTLGLNTLSPEIRALSQNPRFIIIVWGTAGLKLLAGLLALALLVHREINLPRWLLLAATWTMGAIFLLYGGANLFVRGLMAVSILSTPASMLTTAAKWHLLWDLWWLAGGILFCMASWNAGRKPQ